MNMNIYAIYDKAVNAYMRPFVMQSDGQALRVFGDMAVSAEHEIGQHPEDYTIFRLGSFDDNSGVISQEEPRRLAGALELAAASRNKVTELKDASNA